MKRMSRSDEERRERIMAEVQSEEGKSEEKKQEERGKRRNRRRGRLVTVVLVSQILPFEDQEGNQELPDQHRQHAQPSLITLIYK